jgi:hypothetical protein
MSPQKTDQKYVNSPKGTPNPTPSKTSETGRNGNNKKNSCRKKIENKKKIDS